MSYEMKGKRQGDHPGRIRIYPVACSRQFHGARLPPRRLVHRSPPTPIANLPGLTSNGSSEPTTPPQTDTSTGLSAPVETGTSTDLFQAGLPAGFPIYPSGHDFTWIPGLMLKYTVNADVRRSSNFSALQMGAGGYSDLSGGGGE